MRQTQADRGSLQVGMHLSASAGPGVCRLPHICSLPLPETAADTPRRTMVDDDEAARSNTARRLWVHVLEKGWQVRARAPVFTLRAASSPTV
jgi:hypothetical protein